MSIVVQTQQHSLPEKKPRSVPSCTPMLPGFRYHQRREDFYEICRGDWVAADALRVLENVTNKLINKLRSKHRIPENQLPHKDDLWISEMRLDDFEFLSAHSTARSTYARCLHEVSAKKNKPSLVQLRFLSIRFVAWAGVDPELPDAVVYRGKRGKYEESFIVVDANGDYIDSQGKKRSAIEQGWTAIERQFLYEIDAINAALAKLTGQSPPESMKRWHALQRKSVTGETTKSTPGNAQSTSSQTSVVNQGGLSNDEESTNPSLLFDFKNNINHGTLSSDLAKKLLSIGESQQLRSVPWTARTLIALASHHLAIPDPETIDEDQWLRDWAEPAQWLYAATADMDCARAWEDIELSTCAMLSELGGPTWHARSALTKFTAQTLTLRHVVGWDKKTGELNGRNWRSTAKALEAEPWDNYEHIEYSGPPLFDDTTQISSYEQGYTAQSTPATQVVEGSAHALPDDEVSAEHFIESEHIIEVTVQSDVCADGQVSDVDAEQPLSAEQNGEETEQSVRDTEELEVVEQPVSTEQIEEATQSARSRRRRQGMRRFVVDSLVEQILKEHPFLFLEVIESALRPGYYAIGIEYAEGQLFTIASCAEWTDPTEEIALLTEQAVKYSIEQRIQQSQQRNATDGNGYADSQGPPGEAQGSEEGGELR